MRISDWSSDVCSSDRKRPPDAKRPLLREIRSIAKRIPRDVEMADVMALRLEQLGIWAVGCMFQQRPRKQQQVKPADQRHDKTHGRDLENAERRLARGPGHVVQDRKSTRLNSSHECAPRMLSCACKKENEEQNHTE